MVTALNLCRAGSAGVSLLRHDEDGNEIFRWVALAGAYEAAGYGGRAMSRTFSPSGTCLDRGAPQLFDTPARHFTYLSAISPPMREALLVPLRYQDRDLGLIWVIAHDEATSFDSEDVRLLESLGQIAGPAAGHEEALEQAAQEIVIREELLSIGSHELRNPLTTVVGFTNRLAKREDLDAEAQEEIRLVAREANRLRKVIDDFFDLAKLESTAITFDFEEVDLVELLHEQVAGFRMRHPSVPVEEEFEDAPFIRTDPSRVSQIVTNLLENAAKYGGDLPRITTRLRATAGTVHIDVRDEGPGIPLDEQERIFDRAYRLSQRVGSNREGLGLGLYISRELAQRLGGSLTVASEPGHGSTFTLTLPV